MTSAEIDERPRPVSGWTAAEYRGASDAGLGRPSPPATVRMGARSGGVLGEALRSAPLDRLLSCLSVVLIGRRSRMKSVVGFRHSWPGDHG